MLRVKTDIFIALTLVLCLSGIGQVDAYAVPETLRDTLIVTALDAEDPVPAKEPEVQKDQQNLEKQPDKIPSACCRLGTNFVYDACTVANLYLEAGFARHFSINVLATYSPWDISANHKFRTLLIQPEFRYYFKDNFGGHHLGLEGHCAWYNVAIPSCRTRYQDRDGNTPLWGVGIVYGYVVPFGKHWGMDFEIGVGYTHLDYDCYYNIENGAKYTSEVKNFYGPTKLGISLFYRF